MRSIDSVEGLIERSAAPEMRLPEMPPLTLTRNFMWVFGICVASLLVVPVALAWTASLLLN